MRVLRKRINELFSTDVAGNQTPLLMRNHPFKYLILSSEAPQGLPILIYFDQPRASADRAPDSFVMHPGSRIPLVDYEQAHLAHKKGDYDSRCGRAVYVVPLAVNGASRTVLDSPLGNEFIDFIAVEEGEEFTSFSQNYQNGQKVLDVTLASSAIAATTTTTLCDSDVLREFTNQPLYFRGVLEGGAPTNATQIPLELRVREFNAASGNQEMGRVYMFPGGTVTADTIQRFRAFVIIPLGRNYRLSASNADTNRWRLEVHNPTGAPTRGYSVHGEICVGHAEERLAYDGTHRSVFTPAPGAVLVGGFYATLSAKQAVLTYMVTTNIAAAGGVQLTHQGKFYIDTLRGGPLLSNLATAGAMTVGQHRADQVPAIPRHLGVTWAWGTDPGAASEYIASVNVGG